MWEPLDPLWSPSSYTYPLSHAELYNLSELQFLTVPALHSLYEESMS